LRVGNPDIKKLTEHVSSAHQTFLVVLQFTAKIGFNFARHYVSSLLQPKILKAFIEALLDFLYTPFSKIVNRQTFRYVICGGANTLLDIFLYFIAYHYILHKQIVHTPVISISPYIAAFLISFAVTFPTGFLLMSRIVFPGSYLKGSVQLFRYFLLVAGCIILNYVFIKLFVESFHIYPTIAKILATGFVISFSYLTQRNYTFQSEEKRTGT